MDSILTPLDVRLKAGTLEDLASPLYQWFQDGLPDQRSVFTKVENPADTAKYYLKEIHRLLDRTLVTYKNNHKSVADYLHYMDYYRKNLGQRNSFEDFKFSNRFSISRESPCSI